MEAKILPPGSGQALNVIGDNQTVKLTGEDTGGLFTLIEQANPPGVGVPLHVHENEDELYHVLKGSIAFKVQDKSVTATAGTSIFLPRDVPHEFMTVGDVPARTLLMVFPAGAERMFFELNELPAGPPDMAKVLKICGRFSVSFL